MAAPPQAAVHDPESGFAAAVDAWRDVHGATKSPKIGCFCCVKLLTLAKFYAEHGLACPVLGKPVSVAAGTLAVGAYATKEAFMAAVGARFVAAQQAAAAAPAAAPGAPPLPAAQGQGQPAVAGLGVGGGGAPAGGVEVLGDPPLPGPGSGGRARGGPPGFCGGRGRSGRGRGGGAGGPGHRFPALRFTASGRERCLGREERA